MASRKTTVAGATKPKEESRWLREFGNKGVGRGQNIGRLSKSLYRPCLLCQVFGEFCPEG